MKRIFLFLTFFSNLAFAQDGVKPIIDVHLHGYTERSYFPIPGAPATLDEFKMEMKKNFQKFNIVAAMKSGGMYDPEMEEKFLQGYESNNYPKFDTLEFKKMIEEGKIQVWGEFMPMFNGLTLADPKFAPYLAICEREGIPIALHTGGGPPGISNQYKKFRLSLGDPLLIEEVLINYPKLKIYLMHSGGLFYDNSLALMELYPQLYCGLGALLWIKDTPTAFYVEDFLMKAKKGRMIDRIMYGSDAMYWPDNVKTSIETLDSFKFLSEEDKRKIFYENALEFFELDHLNK